jgi:circadian clock protein KaiC
MELALKSKQNVKSAYLSSTIEKTKTGICGFDEITFGGLPKNRPTLIVGGIGTGKTFMSMHFLLNGVNQFQENGVFMTFEEKTTELVTNFSNFNVDIDELVKNKKLYFEHLHIAQYEMHESGKYNIDGLFVRIEHAMNAINAKRIVLDSLDTLFTNLDINMLRNEFKKLFFWLKEKNITAVITAEQGDIYLTRLGLEENVADCVIELTNRVINQISTRRLRIMKYRGSFHANNEYPFVIDNEGMNVFPIATNLIEYNISNQRVSSGIKNLDAMLDNKGFFVGSSILISGSAGTGKTSLASFFAKSNCENNKKCLFCAFEESSKQIMRNMKSIGIDLEKYVTSNNLIFYYARPTLQNLELHFMRIKALIEIEKPDVIILDPVTNLMTEGPNSDVRSMLTRFIDFLKTQQITVMFTAAITLKSVTINPSDEGISSMVDTWLMVEDIVTDNKRNRIIYILKSRGMSHSKEVKAFVIENEGIDIYDLDKNENHTNLENKINAPVLNGNVM